MPVQQTSFSSGLLSIACILILQLAPPVSLAHGPASGGPTPERHIEFPDTANFKTLVLDLHTHSVFSDGHVWPTVRVSEALRDGLDGMAITEHLEFQPHLADIPHPDRNRAFEEALRAAKGHPLTIIPGVEITRTGAPGHMNAIFVKDANAMVKQRSADEPLPVAEFKTREEAVNFSIQSSPLFNGAHAAEVDGKTVWRPYPDPGTYHAIMNFSLATTFDPREVLEVAKDQKAFVFWNHPSFETVNAELNDFHSAATKDGLLHGIEIANGNNYYPNAHRLALKHGLTLLGVSDVHELIDWDYQPEAESNPGHRPVTLALAKGESIDDMREALFARRTVVWWKDMLIGRKPHLQDLLAATLSIEAIEDQTWGRAVKVRNKSDATFKLQQRSNLKITNYGSIIEIAPNGVTDVMISVDDRSAPVRMEFDVLNALDAPNQPTQITLTY